MWVQEKCGKKAVWTTRYSPMEFVIDSHEYVIDDIIDDIEPGRAGKYTGTDRRVHSVHSGTTLWPIPDSCCC